MFIRIVTQFQTVSSRLRSRDSTSNKSFVFGVTHKVCSLSLSLHRVNSNQDKRGRVTPEICPHKRLVDHSSLCQLSCVPGAPERQRAQRQILVQVPLRHPSHECRLLLPLPLPLRRYCRITSALMVS